MSAMAQEGQLDFPPVSDQPVAAHDEFLIPREGWSVWAFLYYMGKWTTAANIYLASSPDGATRSVQFWIGHAPATVWHGSWSHQSLGVFLHFNGGGPGFRPDGQPRRLHGHYIRLHDENPITYRGHDYANRPITLVHYGSRKVGPRSNFVEVKPEDADEPLSAVARVS